MSTRVVDRVENWEERSFAGGYRELHDLADSEFSGVVRAGGAELYMTKGVVVGVQQGDIEDFADARGTVYESPSPALPLLAVIQERGGDVRDEFYSEKTSISEVDSTLSEGGFTGYIELSENVLSGDYYLVYQAGRSMSVGFVGNAGRLIDGDEAFETADDEVGIYKVHAVDVEPIEIPEPEGAATGGAGAGTAGTGGPDGAADGSAATGGATAGTDEPAATGEEPAGGGRSTGQATRQTATDAGTADAGGTDAGTAGAADAASDAATTDDRWETDQGGAGRGAEPGAGRRESTADQRGTAPERGEAAGESRASGAAADRQDAPAEPDQPSGAETRQQGQSPGGGTASDPQPAAGAGGSPDAGGDWDQKAARDRAPAEGSGSTGGDEALGLEQRAIPSLDPDRTEESAESSTRSARDSLERSQGRDSGGQSQARQQSGGAGHAQPQQPEPAVDPERVEQLESDLADREAEIDRLEDELASATRERDDLRERLEAVREERDNLQAEVDRLSDELDRLSDELGAATEAERRITGEEALSGTDIFVRYHSKGDATLEKAHGGSTRKEEVNENLRLEKHTQFDADSVAVGAQSYEEYLDNTVEYQFVEWLVRQLLFEIRDTGHQKELQTLYDVLPAVDRAELAGVVDVVYTADGQETRSQESFDIMLRDRMGNPLLVANLNDSREAATEAMMEDLITAAERVGQSAEPFAGAFLVTRSFFDPGALEVAEDATQGGLLSRDKRKSFVNLSRKKGYHLCLVEARNENFHLAVPEL
jgi:regulator of replication initiation timing